MKKEPAEPMAGLVVVVEAVTGEAHNCDRRPISRGHLGEQPFDLRRVLELRSDGVNA